MNQDQTYQAQVAAAVRRRNQMDKIMSQDASFTSRLAQAGNLIPVRNSWPRQGKASWQ